MNDVSQWWETAIIDMQPGQIELRGHSIEHLIEHFSFVDTIWLMVMGSPPTPGQTRVLQAALVASVDHGPQAPSIAAARMAATCGVGINNALATGINMLGDVHGGAGQQALALFHEIKRAREHQSLESAVEQAVSHYPQKHIPGFGHRFHKPEDPRSGALFAVLRDCADDPGVDSSYADIALAIQAHLNQHREVGLAINIDGASAALYGALGVAPELARGLFCLSRGVGVLAHAWEQTQQGGRNKGPTPPHYRWDYSGKNPSV